MIKKKKKTEEVNEFAAEAEAQGDISHDEAVAPVVDEAKDGDVKKPQLQGHTKDEYGKPKFDQPGTNQQKREVIGEDTDEPA